MKDNFDPNEKSSASQAKRILEYMKEGNRITPLDALRIFGSFRLGARIADIKEMGYAVQSEFVTTESGKRVKAYWL